MMVMFSPKLIKNFLFSLVNVLNFESFFPPYSAYLTKVLLLYNYSNRYYCYYVNGIY